LLRIVPARETVPAKDVGGVVDGGAATHAARDCGVDYPLLSKARSDGIKIWRATSRMIQTVAHLALKVAFLHFHDTKVPALLF